MTLPFLQRILKVYTRQLNNIYEYSCKWGLNINVSKTKVCVFEVRKSNCNVCWSITDEYSDIVDEFCYLGVKLHYTGNLARVIKSLNNQVLKAYRHLLSVFSRINIDTKTKLSLFDFLVVAIILLSSTQVRFSHPVTILEPPTLYKTTSTPVRPKPATCGTPLRMLSVAPIPYPSATATRGSTRTRKRPAWQSSGDYDMSTG